jgi:hypothetical protein
MGLVKRNNVWWMSFMYQGRQIRRSTSTNDKRLAEAIFCKVKVQIAEGQFFEVREERERTFREMMNRYTLERSKGKSAKSAVRDRGALNHLLPMFGEMVLAEITPKLLASYKRQRLLEEAAPATINKELQIVRHAFGTSA